MPSEFDAQYDAETILMPSFRPRLEQLFRDLLAAEEIRAHSVVCRVKTKESCLRKLQKSDTERPLSSLTDLLGLRVITYLSDEVAAAARIVEREFRIDTANSVDKIALMDPDRFGYLSLHYVAQIGDRRSGLPEYQSYAGLKFEIQIRSILQHAWAEIEHDLGYKSEAVVPKAIRRRFSRLAGLLELADDEFVAISQEMTVHQKAARKTISRGNLDVEIDQDSLYSFIQSSELATALDHAIAESMNRPYAAEAAPAYIGKQAERLLSVGFSTIGELSSYLASQEQLLRTFLKTLIAATQEARDKRAPDDNGIYTVTRKGIVLHYAYMLRTAQLNAEGQPTSEPQSLSNYLTELLKQASA